MEMTNPEKGSCVGFRELRHGRPINNSDFPQFLKHMQRKLASLYSSSSFSIVRMTGMSRKKTQVKVIQGTDARRVAFSKRRSGLFKKVNELCNLCTVETALVIFSSDDKAFSFGHPGVDTMVNKLGHPGKPDTSSTRLAQTDHEATLEALNKEYFGLLEQLEAEKKRGEKLKQMRMERQRECWMDKPIDELSLKELLTLKGLLEDVKVKLLKRMQELSIQSTPTTPLAANTGVAVDPSVANPAAGGSVGPNGHGVE